MTDHLRELQPGESIEIRRPPKVGSWQKVKAVALADGDRAIVSAGTPEPEPEPEPPPPEPPAVRRLWGMLPGWAGCTKTALKAAGVQAVVVELNWARAQPSQNTYDFAYLDAKRNEIASWRLLGFEVILNYGLHHAPAWVMSSPLAKFVDQNGTVYAGDEPNLIHGTGLRPLAEAYTGMVFGHLGIDFAAVRVGGGHWGELQYPPTRDSDGVNRNHYWAYGAAAVRPTGAWKPGQASSNGEAATFLDWYLDSLTAFARWQVTSVRRHYPGPIGVLLASDGMRDGDFEAAVAVNLNGSTPSERNGEIQPGFDHKRHILGLATMNDPLIAPWATYAESTGRGGPQAYIAQLGKAAGLYPHMAENSGDDSVAAHEYAIGIFKQYGGSIFTGVRGDTYCTPKAGVATLADYSRLIA